MSGGHFDYVQYRIEQAADDVEQYIRRCYGEIGDENDGYVFEPGYSDETMARFKLCEQTLRLAALMLQRVDWLASGDDGEECFHSRWDEEMSKLLTKS